MVHETNLIIGNGIISQRQPRNATNTQQANATNTQQAQSQPHASNAQTTEPRQANNSS